MGTPIRLTPLGGMDKDTDLELITGGNYQDAHDIRHSDLGGNAGVSVVPVKGNELAFTIPDVTAETKKFRIYVDITKSLYPAPSPNPVTGTITVTDSGVGVQMQVITVTEATVTDFITDLQSQLNIEFDNGGLLITPFTFSNTTANADGITGYFDLVGTDLDNETLQIFHEGDIITSIVQIQDFLDVSGNANMKITGSEQVGKDLFVSSCSEITHGGKYIWELGVVTYDDNTDTYTYLKLLQTNRLGFRPDFQVQIKGEVNGDRVSLYLTDRNSVPRTIYVNKPYVEDGCLEVNGGDYAFNTIDDETYLFTKAPLSSLSLVGVQEGGLVTAGNKRYTGRFLTEDLTPTEFITSLGPINVFQKSANIPSEIHGDDAGEVTNKKVVLLLEDIPAGVYSYFELVAIEYGNESISTKIVQRYPVGTEETSLKVEHTEMGQDNAEISVQEILAVTQRYDTIGAMELINNRLVIANLYEEQDPDLNTWASAIEHTLLRTVSYVALTNDNDIKGVGMLGELTGSHPAYQFAEYQDPQNVLNKMGYMMNDTYRFGIQVRWRKTGRWSKGYWVDDIRIDLEATNITTPDRRIGNLLDSNMTDTASEALNIYHVEFSNVNLSHTVDGVPLYELIDAFRFVRAERIPEVLTTGLFLPGQDLATATGVWRPYFDRTGTLDFASPTGGDVHDSTLLFLQSPDLFYGKQYDYQTGDTIKILGNYREANKQYEELRNSSVAQNHFVDVPGYFTDQSGGTVAYTDFDIVAQSPMSYGKEVTISSGNVMSATLNTGTPKTVNVQHVFEVNTAVFGNVGNATMIADDEAGLWYGQVYRDLGGNLKYPLNKERTLYQTIGHIYTIADTEKETIDDIVVFGGDVFTQKNFMRMEIIPYASPITGRGSGIAYYSQNVVNTQMRTVRPQSDEEGGEPYVFPQTMDRFGILSGGAGATYNTGTIGRGLANWLEQWTGKAEQLWYNPGYDARPDIFLQPAFDENTTFDGRKGAAIAWSATRLSGSPKDDYRVFRPLDVSDLGVTNGPIQNIMELNGALYTWQRGSFQRQYFNDPTTIGAEGGTDVIIGTGSVLGLRGQELTSIGSDKKWAVFKGKNNSGKDVAYWYNDILKKIVRFGGDGVSILSDPLPNKPGISSYLRNFTNFLTEEDEPISGRGVHGVWNQRHDEAIFTFKGFINTLEIPEAGGSPSITINSVYSHAIAPLTHHSGLPSVFRAKSSFTYNNLGTQGPGTGSSWETYWEELGPEDYPQYYAAFTIVFNERKNSFSCFHEYYPNLYLSFFDTFGSVDPLTESECWMHDRTGYINYYGTTHNGSITPVLNVEPDVIKTFEAVTCGSEIVPFRMDFTTKAHTSFLTETDFEEREERFYSTIKNAASAGVVTGDTSRLFGPYLKTKITFETGVFQRLYNLIIKVRNNPRLFNR